MVLPVVHINGTSREELIRLRCDAADKVRQALEALADMAPNGRDYYLVDGSLRQAQDQHDRRASALRGVLDEIEKEYLLLDEGG